LLEIVNLACARGDRPLFQGLSFTLHPGEFLHIQGANGSGKTTLLRTLCGLSLPAEGQIHWQGVLIRELQEDYRRQVCYVGHHNGIQGEFTAAENLAFHHCLAGDAADRTITAALAQLGLTGVARLPAKLLSQGQKRRLALARFLISEKPLWIMDEPITALDVRSAGLMVELFAGHLARGGLIVLTSHQEVTLTTHPVRTLCLDVG
jgi:heme exporter protein A